MPPVNPSTVNVNDVRKILQDADHHVYLTTYQILDRLPDDIRLPLIDNRGQPGAGNGNHFTAANEVAMAAETLVRNGEVEPAIWLDTRGIQFKCGDNGNAWISSGSPTCALYRLAQK